MHIFVSQSLFNKLIISLSLLFFVALFILSQLIRLEDLVLTHTNNPDKRRAGRSTTKTSIDWTTISLVCHHALCYIFVLLFYYAVFLWMPNDTISFFPWSLRLSALSHLSSLLILCVECSWWSVLTWTARVSGRKSKLSTWRKVYMFALLYFLFVGFDVNDLQTCEFLIFFNLCCSLEASLNF